MIGDILVAVVATLIVNEVTDVSPWIAIRLVRWAARHMYAANADRAARRREEWEALINESIPTKISKLSFGLGLGCAGLCGARFCALRWWRWYVRLRWRTVTGLIGG